MYVNHSGWNEKHGAFYYDIYINEYKTDYAIHYQNGMIAKQSTPFHVETRDWNHDGDVYPLFGAWFQCYDKDGSFSGGHFWTPESMVAVLIEAMDNTRTRYGNEVVSIPGITLPEPGKRPNLNDHIRRTEARSMAQDVERNRKMKALGIRQPGEPWAR